VLAVFAFDGHRYPATVKKLRDGSATLEWDDKDPRYRVVPVSQVRLGCGRIVALHHRSPASYRIH
jgi:hypothetical protein